MAFCFDSLVGVKHSINALLDATGDTVVDSITTEIVPLSSLNEFSNNFYNGFYINWH